MLAFEIRVYSFLVLVIIFIMQDLNQLICVSFECIGLNLSSILESILVPIAFSFKKVQI